MRGEPVAAVVLAGGGVKPEMAEATGVTTRALIPVHGVPMLTRVISALQSSGAIGDIAVVGETGSADRYVQVADQGGFVENLFAGLDAGGAGEQVVIATADLPFLTGDSVRDLVDRGSDLGVDIVYPVVPVRACYARYPGIRRTAVKTREGEFTGGNLVLARRSFLERQRRQLQEAYSLRKSPAKLAWLLGPGILLRFAASRVVGPSALSVAHLEKAVSNLLGGRARALISPYPELATDIDRPEDLKALESLSPS